MVKAVVTGAGGRMGGRIISLIAPLSDIKVVAAVEAARHPIVGRDVGQALGLGRTEILVCDKLADCIEQADVVIDFTNREASLRYLKIAGENKRAIVIGSTGFTSEEMKEVKELAKNTRCVLSPNMSVGVNVLWKVLEECSGILGDDYDVEIIEAHHHLKKDAPSGTAMYMAQIIADKLGRDLEKDAVYTRCGIIGERTKREIGIQTIRAGDIVGEHEVFITTYTQQLALRHEAFSRTLFAEGALCAARFLAGKPAGYYRMEDMIR